MTVVESGTPRPDEESAPGPGTPEPYMEGVQAQRLTVGLLRDIITGLDDDIGVGIGNNCCGCYLETFLSATLQDGLSVEMDE